MAALVGTSLGRWTGFANFPSPLSFFGLGSVAAGRAGDDGSFGPESVIRELWFERAIPTIDDSSYNHL
jgi:hypothetical protein